ncbi:adenosylcobinamide-GDP ribazoletransferase [Kribbella sp. CA-293567]|uniref:adenosylcobinamide-GDP ribazoletransferase n=1 Tax=Kribbella sp. CA-293567 TaxID=3002436 RepID=UPI0022DD098E|nr:adenosylcobinamide-GDP ribazoletransferase [Kribbella sp. CA-293567]WBQ02741.1 adenosylcobinamide-GDP ribazoletransferase [Kribbella sp. CA-293567]
MFDAAKLSFGTLSVLPAGMPATVNRKVAGRAMTLAPLVGLLLGGIAAAVVYGVDRLKPEATLLSAVLGVLVLMVLSGGLHLDGLADTADGFGSRKDRETKLRIMKQSDIGPFGVISIVAVLLLDVAALQVCVQNGFGWQAILIAAVASRLTLPWSCRTSVPSARPDGLGAMVAGSVRPYAAALVTLAAVAGAVVLGWLTSRAAERGWFAFTGTRLQDDYGYPTIGLAGRPVGGGLWGSGTDRDATWLGRIADAPALHVTLLGTLAAVLTVVLITFAATRRTNRALGGITGDTLGATVEVALPATLLVLALTT